MHASFISNISLHIILVGWSTSVRNALIPTSIFPPTVSSRLISKLKASSEIDAGPTLSFAANVGTSDTCTGAAALSTWERTSPSAISCRAHRNPVPRGRRRYLRLVSKTRTIRRKAMMGSWAEHLYGADEHLSLLVTLCGPMITCRCEALHVTHGIVCGCDPMAFEDGHSRSSPCTTISRSNGLDEGPWSG